MNEGKLERLLLLNRAETILAGVVHNLFRAMWSAGSAGAAGRNVESELKAQEKMEEALECLTYAERVYQSSVSLLEAEIQKEDP